MFIGYLFLIVIQGLLCLAMPPKSAGDLKDQYLVSNLPGLYNNIQKKDIPLMFSGQLELFPENNTHYFFWKYSDQNKLPENDKRTIFWLNGGPGCSSMDGALMEAGPFRISKEQEVTYNNGSWHKLSDIVFVDQPGGTGFSYTDMYDSELDQIVVAFLRFLDKYFDLFPEDLDNDIYFAGESYAGQYIPYIARGILKHNKELHEGDKFYKLRGLLIGNGWISPNEQSLSYLPYSVTAGIIDTNNPKWSTISNQHKICQKIVNRIDMVADDNSIHDFEISSDTCENILSLILEATKDTSGDKEQCYNMYDYTLKDSYPACGSNWPPDLINVSPFLRKPQVMNNLNLENHKMWVECSARVNRQFSAKNSIPAIHLLPEILEEIPIILFNGNRDIICNYIGTENFIKKMKWNGQKGFSKDVGAIDWIYDNELAGYIKSERNLTFVNVFDSSHMVPFDKPAVSRALIDLITGNFDDKEIDQGDKGMKRSVITYPIGERYKAIENAKSSKEGLGNKETEGDVSLNATISDISITSPDRTNSTASDSTNSTDTSSSNTLSRVTRLIQLLVVIVIVWGVYVLYSSYKSRPTSIIKSKPSTGKKKNVQWADQLRQFQEDDDFQKSKQGFFSKTINKLKGGDSRGTYAPVDKQYEDIELGENPENNDLNNESFIIDSEDEGQDNHSSNSDSNESNSV